ncbi:MAG TPA: adenylate/guanylate cyclase domain-containing protein [Blastocatellia bacterium]
MQETISRIFSLLFGDPRRSSLEHRLLNTISLLNAVTNIGGAFRYLDFENQLLLFLLHLLSGILFLVFYYFSRFKNAYRLLYWPFVLLIVIFLSANILDNAGSLGGAHYYLIPALVIAVVLSGKARNTAVAISLFAALTVVLLMIERYRPAWITPYQRSEDRFADVLISLVFAQIFTGILVMVLIRDLNLERKKSDRLLLNILPESIAEELKREDRVEPLHYDSASVLFTDFVGFTRIAEGLTCQDLIAELDNCFCQFDRIAKKHGLEKIKTIGDAYMAAGGLPAPSLTHAVDCVLAGLEIARCMEEMAKKKAADSQPYWQVRIGIHTGHLVAGVIGREKFSYDVWGDTVNTASRMESSGAAGRVNISSETYKRVKEFFECEHRGKVSAKNKGEIDMYFVKGIRPEFARADGTPNEEFFERHHRAQESGE